jgi:hypothetical protein
MHRDVVPGRKNQSYQCVRTPGDKVWSANICQEPFGNHSSDLLRQYIRSASLRETGIEQIIDSELSRPEKLQLGAGKELILKDHSCTRFSEYSG